MLELKSNKYIKSNVFVIKMLKQIAFTNYCRMPKSFKMSSILHLKQENFSDLIYTF